MTTYLAYEPFMTLAEVQDSGACEECLAEATDAQISAWIDEASDLIAILSGMRVANRFSLVARPCRVGGYCRCDCCHLDAIPLGDPKPTVDSVWINGSEVPTDEYDLHWGLNGWSLVRIADGDTQPGKWPSYQKRYLADTEDDTFAVYLTVGIPVDKMMITSAVLEIVCDIASDYLGGYKNPNELETGIIQAQLGNATVVVDRDRLARLQAGEGGPNLTRLLSIYASGGRSVTAVYSPELSDGWNLNLLPVPVVGS